MPPQSARGTDLIARLKAVVQQSEGMQFQQPLAFGDVALAPGQVLGMSRIDQEAFQTALLQNLKYWNPIHPGRLHRHAAHPALDQPVGHPLQICREAVEAPDRLLVTIRTDRYPMLTATNVDACRVGMHKIQCLPIYFRLVPLARPVNPFLLAPYSPIDWIVFARPGSDK